MMPFSVLRMFFSGLLTYAALGAGIYALYEWNDGISAPETVTVDVPEESRPGTDAHEERTVIVQRDRQGGMPYLISGLALVLLSTGGGWPLWWSLLSAAGSNSNLRPRGRMQRIQRPDGSELVIEHAGTESAPVLLFTHGWSLDRSDWDDLRSSLEDHFHLVFWDLAGLGESKAPRNADHSLDKMAADLEAVLTEATDGPVILVGHSIGGMIQQVFCRMYPEHLESRVRGLIFVHTTYTNPTKTAIGAPILMALQEPVLKPLTYLSIWLAPLTWLSNWQSYSNGSLHLSARLFCFAGRQSWRQLDHVAKLQARAWPAVVGRGSIAMTKFDEQATLPNVHVPVLVVGGENDRLTKVEASQHLARLFPDAKIVTLPDAGHFGFWEHPAEFHATLGSFAESAFFHSSTRSPAVLAR